MEEASRDAGRGARQSNDNVSQPMPMSTNRAGIAWKPRQVGAIWVVLLCLLACAGHDPTSQLQRAESWAATTRELAIERQIGAVGRSYTADLLDKGRQDVHKLAGSLEPSALPETLRVRAPAALHRLDSLMAHAASAVRRGDPVALGAAAASADALGDTLRAFHSALTAR